MSDAVRNPMPFTDREGKRIYMQSSNFKRNEIVRNGKSGFKVTWDVSYVYEDGTIFSFGFSPKHDTELSGDTLGKLYFSDEGAESEEELKE